MLPVFTVFKMVEACGTAQMLRRYLLNAGD